MLNFFTPCFWSKITTFKTMPQQQQHTRPNSITRAFIQSARNERHALEGLINLSAPFRPFTHRRSAWHIKSMPQRQPFYGRIIEEIRKEQVKQESSSDGSPGSPMEECRGLWLSTRSSTSTPTSSRKRSGRKVVYKKSRDLSPSPSPDGCDLDSDSDTESQSRSLKRQKTRHEDLKVYLSEGNPDTSDSRWQVISATPSLLLLFCTSAWSLCIASRPTAHRAPHFSIFPPKITLPEKVQYLPVYTAEQDITPRDTCLFIHFQDSTDEAGLYRKVKIKFLKQWR